MEFITKMHELCLEQVTEGQTAQQLVEKVKSIK